MSMRVAWVAFVLLGSVFTRLSADDGQTLSEEDLQALSATVGEFVESVNARDIERAMSAFATSYRDDNYENTPPWPLYQPLRSKQAMREALERVFVCPVVLLEASEAELTRAGDKAVGHLWTRERYCSNRTHSGRKRIELVQENGSWKICRWEWDRSGNFQQQRKVSALTWEAKHLLEEGNAEGLKKLQSIVETDPRYASAAQLAIADHFFSQRDFQQALQEYRQVSSVWSSGMGPGETDTESARSKIACIEYLLPDQAALEMVAEVTTLESQGKKKKAAELCEELLRSHPNAPLASAWLYRICRTSGGDLQRFVDLINRFPNSREAEKSLFHLRSRPEVVIELATKYPTAPWAGSVRVKVKEMELVNRHKAELPAVRKAASVYLYSLDACDSTSTLAAVAKEYIGLPQGTDGTPDSYEDLKARVQYGWGYANVRARFVRAVQRCSIHPDGKHAVATILGKRIPDIFRNGVGSAPRQHTYLTAALTLVKDEEAWKVSSASLQNTELSTTLREQADEKELEILRQWEQDAQKLDSEPRAAMILVGIADRYTALSVQPDFDRIFRTVNADYSHTYAAKWLLKRKEAEHFYIRYNVPEEHAHAILNLCEAAYGGYKETYGIDLLENYPDPKIEVKAHFGEKLALWVAPDSNPDINLVTPDVEGLGPPRAAGGNGAHHVYGISHEMGHIAIGFEKEAAWTQGIADYLGTQVLSYIDKELGADAWAVPYDYMSVEGPARMMTQMENAQPGTEDAVCKILYEVEQRHGPKVIGDAVRCTKEQGHASIRSGLKLYSVAAFKTSLIDVTGDPTIDELFRDGGFE